MTRIDILLTSLAMNLLALAMPLMILQVYDRVIPENSLNTFAILMLGIAAAGLLDYTLRELRNRVTSWSAARFEHGMGVEAVERVLRSSVTDVEKVPTSEQLERLAAIDSLREHQSGQGLAALSDVPFAVIFLGLIWVIGKELVFAPMVLAGAATVFAFIIGWRLTSAIRVRNSCDDARYDFLFKALSGIHTIKGLGLEAQMIRSYEALTAPLARAVEKVAFLSSVGQSLTLTISNLAMVATAIWGSILVVEGQVSGGTLIACILLAGRAIQPFMRLISVWVQTRTVKVARRRLEALLKLPEEQSRFHAIPPESPFYGVEDSTLRLEDVTVHLGHPDYPVLSDVSFTLPKGAFVSVSGPVGGGKTALLDLLAGLLPPDAGQFKYNGETVSNIGIETYRHRVGYAKQTPFLFKGTIEDNLTLFGDRYSLQQALDLARRIGLDETLAIMPKGLATRIGDTASEILPASVQQQIALVRVLNQKPEILLLDEANSAFDMETDALFRELIREMKGETTIVMVTSRPSLIKMADFKLHVTRGRVSIEAGDWKRTVPTNAAATIPETEAQPGEGGQ